MLRNKEPWKKIGSAMDCLVRRWKWTILKQVKEGAAGYLGEERCSNMAAHSWLRSLWIRTWTTHRAFLPSREGCNHQVLGRKHTHRFMRKGDGDSWSRESKVNDGNKMREGLRVQMSLIVLLMTLWLVLRVETTDRRHCSRTKLIHWGTCWWALTHGSFWLVH